LLYALASVLFIYSGEFFIRFLNEWACVNNIIYTAWILIIFYNQYSVENSSKLNFITPVFWIFISLLFYAPCASIIFSVWEYLKQPDFSSLKIIHHIVNINMYVCFTIGIYKDLLLKNSIEISSTTG
jgi:hypothetical protein